MADSLPSEIQSMPSKPPHDCGYHSLLEHLDARELELLPARMRAALRPLEVALSEGETSSLRANVSWVQDWWFTTIEGRGIAHFRGDEAHMAPDYAVLAIALGGQNRPSGDLRYSLRPGEMILIPWTAGGGLISAGEFRCLVVHIPRKDLDQNTDPGQEIAYGTTVSALMGPGAVVASAIRTLEVEARRVASSETLRLALPGIARLLQQVFSGEYLAAPEGCPHADRVGRVLTYLEVNLATRALSAAQVALACGLSKRQLFRTFAEDGRTFAGTLRRMRMEKARDLLAFHPDVSITEIAFVSGFSSGGHFCRVFKEELGYTPMTYRRQHASYPESGANADAS